MCTIEKPHSECTPDPAYQMYSDLISNVVDLKAYQDLLRKLESKRADYSNDAAVSGRNAETYARDRHAASYETALDGIWIVYVHLVVFTKKVN